MGSNINYLINRMKDLLDARWGKASSDITNYLPERIEAVLDIEVGKASYDLIQESCEEVIGEVDKLISSLNSNKDKELIECMKILKGNLTYKRDV